MNGGLDYRELLNRWELPTWSASTLDLSVDRQQWRTANDVERRQWQRLSRFLAVHQGECSVEGTLIACRFALPRAEQQRCLNMQIADEDRHAVFFRRFGDEVLGQVPLTAQRMSDAPWLSPLLQSICLDRLPHCIDRFRCTPRDVDTLVEAFTFTHVVIESCIAQSVFREILRDCRRLHLFPGYCRAIVEIMRDEARHIAFGMRVLRDLVNEEPARGGIITRVIRPFAPLLVGWMPTLPMRENATRGGTRPTLARNGLQILNHRLRALGLPPILEPTRAAA